MQNVILKFHPTIQKYTNGLSEHTVKINDLVDLRNSLEYLFPQLGVHIKRIRCGLNSRENIALVNTKKRVLDRDDYLIGTLRKSDTHFHVVPLFLGGGGEGGTQQLLLGAALIGIGFMMPGSTIILGMSIKAMVMKMGVSMVISGVMGMIMKTPKPSVTGGQTTD